MTGFTFYGARSDARSSASCSSRKIPWPRTSLTVKAIWPNADSRGEVEVVIARVAALRLAATGGRFFVAGEV